MVRAIVACMLVGMAGACGAGGAADGGSDAGGDGGTSDVVGRLTFELVARPPLPSIAPDVTVDELRLVLRDVRAIGDSAPGDPRTSVAELALEWRVDDDPPPLVFAQAPPGIYSSLEARLGRATSGDDRFEIRGRVLLAGVWREFQVHNESGSALVGVGLEGLVVGAEPRVAVIGVSLAFLAEVPWAELDDGEGELELDSGDPQMAALEAALASGFFLVGVR